MVLTLKATITMPGVGGLRTERIVRLSPEGVEAQEKFPMELYWCSLGQILGGQDDLLKCVGLPRTKDLSAFSR